MIIVFLIALALAWPTYGLSLAVYFALVFVRAFLRAKARRHDARKIGAGRDLLAGSGHRPTWFMQEDRRDEFGYAVVRLAMRNGVPESFVRGLFENKENMAFLVGYIGLLEDRGGAFIEQQMAASEFVKKLWLKQGRPEMFDAGDARANESIDEQSLEPEQEVPCKPAPCVDSHSDGGQGDSSHQEGAHHFISDDDEAESHYSSGVQCLRRGDFDEANTNFKAAALKGHVSAYWNLALLNGSGRITPFDIDYAADCFRTAANGGHPTATKALYMLEAADRGGFGYNNLKTMITGGGAEDCLPAILMICACRFTHVLCKQHDVTDEVTNYELPAAAKSEHPAVREFVRRTGIDLPRRRMRWVQESPDNSHMEFYSPDLEEGSPADGITDGFNQITVAFMGAGYSDELAAFARCTTLGYIVSKSGRGTDAEPLLGFDSFFDFADKKRDSEESEHDRCFEDLPF
jgi:hypothetical protein